MVLYNGMASTSPCAALYFVALMTFGNYVLFNLLVAILVEGFQAEVSKGSFYFLSFNPLDLDFFLRILSAPSSIFSCLHHRVTLTAPTQTMTGLPIILRKVKGRKTPCIFQVVNAFKVCTQLSLHASDSNSHV